MEAIGNGTWLYCWFHMLQNLQQKVPPKHWSEFRALVFNRRDTPTIKVANRRLDRLIKRYRTQFPEAYRCLSDEQDASLNHPVVPPRNRQQARTENLVERSFVEERRRTKVGLHLWQKKQLTKLVIAVQTWLIDSWNRHQFSEIECQ